MNFLSLTHSMFHVYLKLTNNTISIQKMFWQYLLFPWTFFGIAIIFIFKMALESTSGIPMNILVYIMMPLFFLYLFIINLLITIKCFKLPNSGKKYALLTVFIPFSLFTGISGLMFLSLSIMTVFTHAMKK